MALLLVADLLAQLFFKRLQQIKRDVGGLEVFGIGVGDVVDQRAQGAGARRGDRFLATNQRGGVETGQQPGGDGLRVTLDAGKLAGKHEPWRFLEAECFVQQQRGLDVGVAMDLAVAQEARIFKAGNHAQHARLLAEFQMVLEADQVVAVGANVLLAQLHYCPGAQAGAGIAQANRLHGAKAQRVAAAAGEDFNGEAALEIIEFFPLLGFGGLGGQQGIDKALVLLAVHGAVDVVGCAFVPARGHVDAVHVNGIGIDDGGDGVVKGQVTGTGDALDLGTQRVGGEGASRQNGALRAVLVLVERGDFLAEHANVGLGGDGLRDATRELDTIDGEGVARGYGGFIGDAQKG